MKTIEKGSKVVLGNMTIGQHPTNPGIQVCTIMKQYDHQVLEVTRCCEDEKIFQVKDSEYYFHYDHIAEVVK